MFIFENNQEIRLGNTYFSSTLRLDRPERKKEMVRKIVHSAVFLIIFLLMMCDIKTTEASPSINSDIAIYHENGTVTLSDVQQGSLLFNTDKDNSYLPAPTLDTNVEISINGMIARTKLEQSFRNPGNTWLEGIYVFPLPENAAVDHLRMKIGERIIEGQIQEREQAKKTYQAAKQQGKKASLVEQQRPNLFTNSVANIGPGETITISIEYQQTLAYEIENGTGKFQIRFPMSITPRYIPGQALPAQLEKIAGYQQTGWAMDTNQVPDASRITPPIAVTQSKINPVKLKIELDAGFPINEVKSLYHAVTVTHTDANRITVTLQDEQVPADRDFNLIWRPDAGSSPKAALFSERLSESVSETESENSSEENNGERYHLVMVMPPTEGYHDSQPLPREVIYIIDTSGSMEGDSITQAKQALRMAIDHLRPRDRFNIIQFNSVTDILFNTARSASPNNLVQARHYIASLHADGGTEMVPALQAALKNVADNGYVRQIIFLTDGAVGNESALFNLVQQQLGQSRLFTVGIGSAPNSYFMSKAAQFGRGTFTYIANVNEVTEKMTALFTKLESPVLSDLKISWPANSKIEIWPKRLPDLYLGEPLIFSAKTTDMAGELIISGLRVGQQWQMNLALQGGNDAKGVHTLWARNQISSLMDKIHEGEDKDKIRQQIVDVALQHHLVSKFTSLVAVDVTPSRADSESLQTAAMKNNLPAGMVPQHIVGQLAQTATPAQLNLVIGMLLLMLALLLTQIVQRNARAPLQRNNA